MLVLRLPYFLASLLPLLSLPADVMTLDLSIDANILTAPRNLHECEIPMATEARVQTYWEEACPGADLNGINCRVAVPENILRAFRDECSEEGGDYLGISDYDIALQSTVCVPNAAYICSIFDPEGCNINPMCTWQFGSCTAGTGSCFPVRFQFVFAEKPYCISPDCDCSVTAVEIVYEEEALMLQQVSGGYAQFGNPTWTTTANLDVENTCSEGTNGNPDADDVDTNRNPITDAADHIGPTLLLWFAMTIVSSGILGS